MMWVAATLWTHGGMRASLVHCLIGGQSLPLAKAQVAEGGAQEARIKRQNGLVCRPQLAAPSVALSSPINTSDPREAHAPREPQIELRRAALCRLHRLSPESVAQHRSEWGRLENMFHLQV